MLSLLHQEALSAQNGEASPDDADALALTFGLVS
jgi:hypothetical protein